MDNVHLLVQNFIIKVFVWTLESEKVQDSYCFGTLKELKNF